MVNWKIILISAIVIFIILAILGSIAAVILGIYFSMKYIAFLAGFSIGLTISLFWHGISALLYIPTFFLSAAGNLSYIITVDLPCALITAFAVKKNPIWLLTLPVGMPVLLGFGTQYFYEVMFD